MTSCGGWRYRSARGCWVLPRARGGGYGREARAGAVATKAGALALTLLVVVLAGAGVYAARHRVPARSPGRASKPRSVQRGGDDGAAYRNDLSHCTRCAARRSLRAARPIRCTACRTRSSSFWRLRAPTSTAAMPRGRLRSLSR